MDVVIINSTTGVVLQTARTTRDDLLPEELANKILIRLNLAIEDYTIIESVSGRTTNEFNFYCYVLNGSVFDKGHMNISVSSATIIANGIDESILSNVPTGSVVSLDTEVVGIIPYDGIIEITSNVPKSIKILFSHEHYHSKEITINAT